MTEAGQRGGGDGDASRQDAADAGGPGVIIPLGLAQTIAWASSYYLPAILAEPIAKDLSLSPAFLFGALSGALALTGLLGPWIGSFIDRAGGRAVLMASNLILACGLIVLGVATTTWHIVAAWALLGIGMAAGLYEPAFATLTRLYGFAARRPITGITLVAGFASTVGWPATAWIAAHHGWRAACFTWAAAHLLLALPLNARVPRAGNARATQPIRGANADDGGPVEGDKSVEPRRFAGVVRGRAEGWLMAAVAFVFAATGFVSSGISALLPAILMKTGSAADAAIFAAALVGPAQVAARIVEARWLIKYHPLMSARLAVLLHPVGTALFFIGGPALAAPFSMAYGAGNGILTIARGTLPLALFGPLNYGRRLGLLALPARATGAAAPFLMGLLLERFGIHMLWVTTALSLAALAVLIMIRVDRAEVHEPRP